MADEEKKQDGMTEDYIKVINDLKSNTVSKEEYEAMREENRKLLQSIVQGSNLNAEEQNKQEPIDIQQLRNDLFNGENNNLQYAEKALKLRRAILDNGGDDIFVPNGSKIAPTDNDYICAQKVADAFASCIEYAQGNPEVFTNELQRITRDVRR